MKNINIVFMGTPEIAVESLNSILKSNYNISGVVTVPDKPSGRGLQTTTSAVKNFSIANQINVLQPENLSESSFIEQVKLLKPDIIVVVAFRKLPDEIIALPRIGTFNLHASLLPQYRGAAPINWAIINGEVKTGLTTFLLNNKIDTGDILLQREITIDSNDNASSLYDKMKLAGAELVLKTIQLLTSGSVVTIRQNEIAISGNLNPAPKIYKEDCRINWNHSAVKIHNLIRGLSYKPGAYTEIISPDNKVYMLKILKSEALKMENFVAAGTIVCDGKNDLKVAANDGYISLKEIQLQGKKIMKTDEFLRGFNITNHWETR